MTTTASTLITIDGPLRVIAHRGDPVGHDENTLLAVAAGLQAGADLVEVDVRATADGEIVLLHDATLNRIWGVDAAVADLTSAELDRRVRPHGGAPRLLDALALVGGTGRGLLVDTDDPEIARAAQGVARAALVEGLVDAGQIVWCGRPTAMAAVREQDRAARILLSWDERTDVGRLPSEAVLAAIGPEAFNPDHTMIGIGRTPSVTDWCADRGLPLCCWTVDRPERMRELLDLGVRAMITNRPAQLVALLQP